METCTISLWKRDTHNIQMSMLPDIIEFTGKSKIISGNILLQLMDERLKNVTEGITK